MSVFERIGEWFESKSQLARADALVERARAGVTVIMPTHILEVAERMAERRVLVTFSQQSPTVAPIPASNFTQPGLTPPDQVDTGPWQPIPADIPATKPRPIHKMAQPTNMTPGTGAQRRPMPVTPTENPLNIDWITWILGLLALITVGGLIPFFIWVYYVVYPPF